MRLKSIYIILLLVLTISGSKAQERVQKGDLLFTSRNYRETLRYFEAKKKLTTEQQLKKAFSLEKLGHLNQAETLYTEIKEEEWPFSGTYMLNYAEALRQQGKYKKAKEVYAVMNPVPEALVEACNWALKSDQNNRIELHSIKTENRRINGFYRQGDKALIPVGKDELHQEFQWLNLKTEKTEKFEHNYTWSYNLNCPNVVDDTLLIYSETVVKNKYYKKKEAKAGKITDSLDNKLWIRVVNLKTKQLESFPYNSPEYGSTHPYYSKEENRLYFASEMPGGYGGFDIYYTDKTKSGWGKPVNLGEKINTAYNEGFPSVKDDILYFSSEGHPGYGGFDIYEARLKGAEQSVKNMKSPINSSFDDIAFQKDSKEGGYFVSARGEGGKDQILQFVYKALNVPCVCETEKVKVQNKKGILHIGTEGQNIKQQITLSGLIAKAQEFNKKNKNKIKITAIVSDNNGLEDLIEIPEGRTQTQESAYLSLSETEKHVQVSYSTQQIKINNPEVIKLPLEVEEKGKKNYKCGYWIEDNFETFNFSYVYFEFDKFKLETKAKERLNKVSAFLKKHPDISISLLGYADPVGTDQYNAKLSAKRAETVANFLKQKGIEKRRIVFMGKGVLEKDIARIKSNNTNIEHALQRTVIYKFQFNNK